MKREKRNQTMIKWYSRYLLSLDSSVKVKWKKQLSGCKILLKTIVNAEDDRYDSHSAQTVKTNTGGSKNGLRKLNVDKERTSWGARLKANMKL